MTLARTLAECLAADADRAGGDDWVDLDAEVPSGPPRVRPPRLFIITGARDLASEDDETYAVHEVATIRDDLRQAAEYQARTRRHRPDEAPVTFTQLVAWFALRRTDLVRGTLRDFLDPSARYVEVAAVDDNRRRAPGADGRTAEQAIAEMLADTARTAAGHRAASDDEAALVEARGLLQRVEDGAEPTPPRHHDETAWLDPPPILDVLTECVLTAAPPPTRARATAPA